MPCALLIDFDGVLRQWPDLADWPCDIAQADIRSIAFAPALLRQVILGEIQDDAWRNVVVDGLARSHGRLESRSAVDLWSRSAGALWPEVQPSLDKAKIMSNARTRHDASTQL